MAVQKNPRDYNLNNTKSVSRTLEILSTFNEDTPFQRVSDIAEKLNMNISTVSRHLTTMLNSGFLERDDISGHYFLGIQIISLAGVALHSHDSFRHAYPELQRLSNKLGVHCYMGVPRNDEIIHFISICCEDTAELFIPIGHHHPMYCSAMGRVILAHRTSQEVQTYLESINRIKYTPQTKIELDEIKKELNTVRRSGYSILVNELADGKYSIAAPIFDRSRKAVAAVSLSGNTYTANLPQTAIELAASIQATAGRISGKLGYFPK